MSSSETRDSYIDAHEGRGGRAVAKSLKDILLIGKEGWLEPYKEQNSISVWLVGMATASMALIISQASKFPPHLHPALKFTFGFLALTVVSGALFRISCFFLQQSTVAGFHTIIAHLTGASLPSIRTPPELPEGVSVQDIIALLSHETGIDIDLNNALAYNNDVEYWKSEYHQHVEIERRLADCIEQSESNTVEGFFAVIAQLEGMTIESLKKRTQKAAKSKRWLRLTAVSFFVSMCVSFIMAVSIVAVAFITTDFQGSPPTMTTAKDASSAMTNPPTTLPKQTLPIQRVEPPNTEQVQ